MLTKSHYLSVLLLLLVVGLAIPACHARPLDHNEKELAERSLFPILKNGHEEKRPAAAAATATLAPGEVSPGLSGNVKVTCSNQTSKSAGAVVKDDGDHVDVKEAEVKKPEIDLDYSPPHEHPPHHN